MNPFIRFTATAKTFATDFETIAYDTKFIYIHTGKGNIIINDRNYALDSGTLCYIPPGNRYMPYITPAPSSKFSVINFDFTQDFCRSKEILYPVKVDEYNHDMALLSHEKCEIDMFKTPFVCQKAFFVEELINSVVREFEKKTTYSDDIAASYLKCVIYNLAQFKNDKDHSLYSKIENYILTNYATISSASQISKALNYHPYHISRVLKKHSGLTLHKYILNCRIKTACDLLRNSNLTINQISKKVGYENQNQFSNIFSREIGTSPTEYRKMNLFY